MSITSYEISQCNVDAKALGLKYIQDSDREEEKKTDENDYNSNQAPSQCLSFDIHCRSFEVWKV